MNKIKRMNFVFFLEILGPKNLAVSVYIYFFLLCWFFPIVL